MKNRAIFWMLILCLVLSSMMSGNALAEDESSEGVTKFGVTHNVAPDREIVKVGGRYEPEGIDFYLKRKFDATDTRMVELINKLDEMDKRLKSLEEKLELLFNKLAG